MESVEHIRLSIEDFYCRQGFSPQSVRINKKMRDWIESGLREERKLLDAKGVPLFPGHPAYSPYPFDQPGSQLCIAVRSGFVPVKVDENMLDNNRRFELSDNRTEHLYIYEIQ